MHRYRTRGPVATARLTAGALLAALVHAAYLPSSTPFLRNVDGQTWATRVDVAIAGVVPVGDVLFVRVR